MSDFRKYEQVWNKIKNNGFAMIRVTPAYVSQAKRGISKEKDQDASFKLKNADIDYFFLRYEYNRATNVLTIRLKQRVGLEEKVL
jgi:hypothetical protein